jgi:hypothetical protein
VDGDDQAALAQQDRGPAGWCRVGHPGVLGQLALGGQARAGLEFARLDAATRSSRRPARIRVGLSTLKSGISGTVDFGPNPAAVKGLSVVGGAE